MVDYSKWDNIYVSDDEEVSPYVDRDSFLRVLRQKREQEKEMVKVEEADREDNLGAIRALLAELTSETESLSEEDKSAKQKELQDRQEREAWYAERAAEREKNFKWDADNICTTKWEKTVVNTSKKPDEAEAELVGEAKALQQLRVARAAAEGAAVAAGKTPAKFGVGEAGPDAGASSAAAVAADAVMQAEVEDEDAAAAGDSELELLVDMLGAIPRGKFERLETFVKKHAAALLSKDMADHLSILGIRAIKAEATNKAKRWVHHSYMVQYMLAMGGIAGVQPFFRMMLSGNKQAVKAFNDDWLSNYHKLVAAVAEEMDSSDDEDAADAAVAGESTASGLTKEEQDAIAATEDYQRYAACMDKLPEDLRNAFLAEDLGAVQAALSAMDPQEAQTALELCEEAGLIQRRTDDDA